MIDTVHLVFGEQFRQMVAQFQRTVRVPAEGLLDNDTRPTPEKRQNRSRP